MTQWRMLIPGAAIAVSLSAGCSKCDSATMPPEPRAPSASSTMDTVDRQLSEMKKKHEESRRQATPDESLLSAGADAGADRPQ